MTTANSHAQRLQRFEVLSRALTALSDEQLSAQADAAEQLGSGIGGSTLRFTIEGCTVFAKRVRLCDLERRAEHRFSTANLFDLPSHCHRNVGSPGLGVWRELAAQQLATEGVRSGRLHGVPMLYHWRELAGAASPKAAPVPAELSDVAGMAAFWHEGPDHSGPRPMTLRLQALNQASASVLMVMEHLPHTLSPWLAAQHAAGPEGLQRAADLMTRCIHEDLPALNALGLLHGDAHHGNLLTDGERIYFADFGLALSRHFELSPPEHDYLQTNATLDAAYLRSKWLMWLIQTLRPASRTAAERMAIVQAMAEGVSAAALLPGLCPDVARQVQGYAPVAEALQRFYQQLHAHSRASPYPQAAIEALLRQEG